MLTRRQLVLAQQKATKTALLKKLAADLSGVKDEARALLRTFKIAGLLKSDKWKTERVEEVQDSGFDYYLEVPGISKDDVEKFDYVLAQLKDFIGSKMSGGRSKRKHGDAQLMVWFRKEGSKYTLQLVVLYWMPKEFQQETWKHLYKELGDRGLATMLKKL
jgi:hypothetical protein